MITGVRVQAGVVDMLGSMGGVVGVVCVGGKEKRLEHFGRENLGVQMAFDILKEPLIFI